MSEKFKVGDKVRITGPVVDWNGSGDTDEPVGLEGTLNRYRPFVPEGKGRWVIWIFPDSGEDYIFVDEESIELVSDSQN